MVTNENMGLCLWMANLHDVIFEWPPKSTIKTSKVDLKKVVSSQTTQNKCQENKILNLGAKIVEEMEDHEDDVFFTPGSDLIDVEGSKPAMALSFMKWISQEKDFEYLFLTEDTSFVAINKVGEKQSWNENVI